MNSKRVWEFDDAVSLIREIEPHFQNIGLHVGFTGSVLRQGFSSKDMSSRVLELLTSLGWKRIRNRQEMLQCWRSLSNEEVKWVEVYSFKHRRIDVMFLQ